MSYKTKRRSGVRQLCVTAVLAALATALMYLEISVPFVPSFLKYDFSDLPALIASFGVAPWAGVAVELIKNLVHLPMSSTGGVGELANFILGACFVLPAGLVYYFGRKHNFNGRSCALWGAVVGTLLMSAVSLPVNYYITYPVYEKFMPMDVILSMYMAINPAATTLWKALLMFNLPFTFVKGLISVVITFLVYKKISPILHGRINRSESDKEIGTDVQTVIDDNKNEGN